MNKVEFRYAMGKRKDNVEAVAGALGIAKGSLYAKIAGRIAFTVADINTLKARWKLTATEVSKIFLE